MKVKVNVKITEITKNENGSLKLFGEYLEEDKDFKSTKKVNWLSIDSCLVKKHFYLLLILLV